MPNNRVTICACASRPFIDKDKVALIAAVMKDCGYEVSVEADLCRKVMQASEDMTGIASGVIMACYTRAIRSHLDWLGIEAEQIIDIRNSSYDEIFSQLGVTCADTDNIQGKGEFMETIKKFPHEEGVDAWYPVLDKTRCNECGKCHDFCLFGVYSLQDGKVCVTQPHKCKNNCPACARMCPNKAIIFPKYGKSPINGGTAQEEVFNPDEMNRMYNERLRMRLQQRKANVSLIKENNK
jgi:NAD-dependent dihydropyrimidine dehydrogenase PreA subunit